MIMLHRDTPIQRKLMGVILLTTTVALVVSCVGFISYEIYTIHNNMGRSLDTRAELIAANVKPSSPDQQDRMAAAKVMDALKTDPRMMSGCIYDRSGHIY